tara:strand:- start:1729 stop:2601 length:873 start_codon:yes stop_codon:yes gene_type:complete
MNKKPFYFSIDLEDFHYDVMRSMGSKNIKIKKNDLLESYSIVKKISEKYFHSKKITFFVTGVLARKFPFLIKKIFEDGNEIACHYNYHERISESNKQDLIKNLNEAIYSIESIIGEKPVGFRAPFFGIEEENIWAYEEIAKRFKYDSSFRTSKPLKFFGNNHSFKANNQKIEEYYVYCRKILSGLKMRSGGTYFRLFPIKSTLKTMIDAYENGHIPLLYLHPYDLTQEHNFFVNWNEMGQENFFKKMIFWIRQFQWSHMGHKSIEEKIKIISNHFEHQGPMRDILKNEKY